MIELNIHNFLFIFKTIVQNIHSNFIVVKIIDVIILFSIH